MAAFVALSLFCLSSVVLTKRGTKEESYDYWDRTCDPQNNECFHPVLQAHGECTLSENKNTCSGDGCKFIGNSNMRMCVNPAELHQLSYDEMRTRVSISSISMGSQQLCLFDVEDNVYDTICKLEGGNRCDLTSKKCAFHPFKWPTKDNYYETLRHELDHKLPWDYTDNLLIVIDGTSTKTQFEAEGFDAEKNGQYGMRFNSRWPNGNWDNHNCNFYEDYRGAKYYWYGPDANELISAGTEVEQVTTGAVNTVCDFIANNTKTGKEVKDINIDIIGYSRGGYISIEIARTLDKKGCKSKGIDDSIRIRFMGLYDPVSSVVECEPPNVINCLKELIKSGVSVVTGDDDEHMPTNVNHIVISYGDPQLGSRPYFNTCETEENRKEIEKQWFRTTHGGIGGTPMEGDFETVMDIQSDGHFLKTQFYKTTFSGVGEVKGYDAEMECEQSMQADQFIRSKATEYGLPIDATNDAYYDFRQCPDGWKSDKQIKKEL
eukprot:449466_1